MEQKYNLLNENQKFIVEEAIRLIETKEPFFMNIQGQGGSGKSFIIHYIGALYPDINVRTAYTAKAASLLKGVHLHKIFCMK